ncbi:Endonuclease/Exonuclease/phosphatase family protein [Tepidimonas alkaliphilus]|uniref:Endonuclease/Exonuclease/phosphatase family protein n=1 Tax=Tepidimonas alkaliphilus TaxID=2588942 RepID=A0A554W6I9_9BURK|nr:endonuclease/exonuclease/phosphatase family protein [Tepidimonas alkaliphilus]TSE19189.1 Endonuclease/Exonuclease/phosphatase family protein [Tepidimonas alkaliphilus]
MPILRIATYNIHKGVQGVGPLQRLEIHNLRHAVAQLDADIVCLQEVRAFHHRLARRFGAHWPHEPQAQVLAPPGWFAVYHTNALTRHGEHGNALLSRFEVLAFAHRDVSDHALEQRGLLHVTLSVPTSPATQAERAAVAAPQGAQRVLHVIVVHLGLMHASRRRQVAALGRYLAEAVPPAAPLVVAGDFNDWGEQLHADLARLDLHTLTGVRVPTFPARLPLLALDRIYVRGLRVLTLRAPREAPWRRLSDHLPLVAEVAWG